MIDMRVALGGISSVMLESPGSGKRIKFTIFTIRYVPTLF